MTTQEKFDICARITTESNEQNSNNERCVDVVINHIDPLFPEPMDENTKIVVRESMVNGRRTLFINIDIPNFSNIRLFQGICAHSSFTPKVDQFDYFGMQAITSERIDNLKYCEKEMDLSESFQYNLNIKEFDVNKFKKALTNRISALIRFTNFVASTNSIYFEITNVDLMN